MQRNSLGIALVIGLLTVSAFAISGSAHAASPGASVVRPAAPAITVQTLTYYGAPTSSYDVGQTSGKVFFTVSDYATTLDASATVTIHDKNASRDKIPDPAYTTTIKFDHGNTNSSYTWSIYYLIPVTLTFGGQWNITVSATNGGFNYANFTVATYYMDASASPSIALPAHTASVIYWLYRTANDAPYTQVSNVELTGTYFGAGAMLLKLPNTPVSVGTGAYGWYNFTIPTDASGTISFRFFANTTANGGNAGNMSATVGTSMTVGHLAAPLVRLGSCPGGCSSSTFAAGTPVYVSVLAQISGISTGPAAGINATFKFVRGSTFVNPPGNPPNHVTTDANGAAAISFIASLSVFSTSIANTVSVTLTDPAEPASGAVTTNASFLVTNLTTSPTITVQFDSAQYYSGDTAKVTWAIGGTNATVTAGWTGSYWYAYRNPYQVLASGTAAAGSTSGAFNVGVPLGYTGSIWVYVTINNATQSLYGYAQSAVSAPTIQLSPSELAYLPGDTVNVGISTTGQALSSAALWETVVDSSGNWISNAAVSGNQLSISVPNHGAPTGYTVRVTAQTVTGGLIANASVHLFEASGIDLELWVSTPSSYTDGSFQPGQTVTVQYVFTPQGLAVLPRTFNISLNPTSTYYSGRDASLVQTSSSSGSFQYKIPGDAKSGVLIIQASARMGGSTCTSNCYSYTLMSIPINSAPPALGYQLGAGSGVTVAWLILLVIVLVIALIGYLMMRRRGRNLVMKPETGHSPPAGGSSS